MPITVACSCGKRLRVQDQQVGRRVRCPGCGKTLQTSEPAEPEIDPARYEHVDSFRRKQRLQIAFVPIVGVMIFLFVVLANFGSVTRKLFRGFPMAEPLLLAVIVIGVVAIAITSIINWRCPACRKYLGKNLFVERCPKCNVPFREGE
jgi:uncharacterized integral membrane protein